MKRTLVKELNLAIALTLAVVAFLFALVLIPYQMRQKAQFVEERTFFLDTFKRGEETALFDAIFEKDVDSLSLHLKRMGQTKGFKSLALYDGSGQLLAAYPDEPSLQEALHFDKAIFLAGAQSRSELFHEEGEEALVYVSKFVAINELIGFLQIHYSLDDFLAQQKMTRWFFVALLVATLVFATILLNWRLSGLVTRPIGRLIRTVDNVEQGNLDVTTSKLNDDEIGRLHDAFAKMIERLKTSFQEIEEQNIELKEMDTLRKEFLANVTHELRTPLHAIIGFSEGMIDEVATEEHKRYLQLILDNGRALDNIASQLLMLSSLKAHRVQLHCEPCYLHDVTEKIALMSPKLIGDKPIRFHVDLPPDLPKIMVDQLRLQQVFLNLVENAIKFTEKGEILLSARAHDSCLRVTITDTGIGIPGESIGSIFDEFRQVDGSSERYHGGVGLGLAIVKELISLHGGSVWVESRVGEGSSFHFTVPIA